MTKNIYVTSTQAYSGKSALCVGLLRRFQRDGYKIGYMKPVSTSTRMVCGEHVMDEDCHYVKFSFNLPDALEDMAPVLLHDRQVAEVLEGREQDYGARVKTAYENIARDRDIVVLEGGGSLREGWIVNLAPPHVAELLNAPEIIVVPYDHDLQVVDDLITARVRLGDTLIGGVVNSVPGHRLDFVRQKVVPFVERHQVPILAVLPKEPVLLSVSVAELRDGLCGEVLCAHQHLDELVENVMVGAMSVDNALTYFRRKANKAVITGGDRADIMLAALETSTKCLILTGNLRPSPLILGRAEEKGVPVILTYHDTYTVVEMIESFFGKTRFHQQHKVERLDALLERHFNFPMLYQALGLR
ncbi:MAG: phosphotransacetylase family protein [Anaerolineae bacterium]|nr:phosphotransacetylase family protein [Anaerolineae bacterium]